MKDKRQHFLPRYLLKGFTGREKGTERYSWVYHKDKEEAYETNHWNIAQQRYFYGNSERDSANDEITKIENVQARFIDEIREYEDGCSVLAQPAKEYVSLLVLRTRSIRENVGNYADELVKGASKILHEWFPGFQGTLADLVNDEFTKITNSLSKIIEETKTNSLKAGHIRVLKDKAILMTKMNDYNRMKWFIRKSTSPFILGDVGCAFEIDGKLRFKPFNDKDDSILRIYAPLSTDTCLVGTADDELPEYLPEEINDIMARCSMDFFVSSEQSAELRGLLCKIGQNSRLVSEDDIRQLLEEFKKQLPVINSEG